jgi:hypothetical protein
MSIKQYKITSRGGDVCACANEEFVMENFPAKPLLNYALEVEKITTSKKQYLILSVITKPNFIFMVVLLDTQYSLDHSY